jgi:hypothetical protein
MSSTTTPGTRPPTPGSEIVVPFSEIAALLRTRLSDLELTDLLARLIGSRSSLIQPGDLITAEWAMDIENRLVRLEGGGTGVGTTSLGAKAVQTLLETFDAYGRLLARRNLFPDGTGADAVAAAFQMSTSIQNVMVLAAATTGLAQTATAEGVRAIFQRLYAAQNDLAVLFASAIPGVSNPAPRLLFAQRLRDVLDNDDGATSALSLKNALRLGDANAAILAQNRINGVVATESGDRVVGSIDVTARGTTRGDTLVIGDPGAFGFNFRIINKTNRELRMTLDAFFLSPREAWNAGVTIVGGSGQTLTLRPFDPANPLDPAAMRDLVVNVTTPPGATNGETGTLRFRATVPAPIGIVATADAPVKVGTAGTAPRPTNVLFAPAAPVVENGNLGGAVANDPIDLRFDATFTTTTGPTTRDFRLRLDSTNTAADVAKFSIDFANVELDPANSTAVRKQSKPFPMTDGQAQGIKAQVVPLATAAGTNLNLTATIEAVDDTTVADTRSFTVRAI